MVTFRTWLRKHYSPVNAITYQLNFYIGLSFFPNSKLPVYSSFSRSLSLFFVVLIGGLFVLIVVLLLRKKKIPIDVSSGDRRARILSPI